MSPTPTPPPESKIKVIELKTDPKVAIPFLLIVIGVVVAAVMGKVSPEIAALILGALGFPSVVGMKTMPQLVTALVAELQRNIASTTPPPIPPVAPTPLVSKVPPSSPLPTGTSIPVGSGEDPNTPPKDPQ